jgi:hypothetical protein
VVMNRVRGQFTPTGQRDPLQTRQHSMRKWTTSIAPVRQASCACRCR